MDGRSLIIVDPAKALRLDFAADILQGMTEGVEGDRLTALIEWAVYGKLTLESSDALVRIFAAPWIATKDEDPDACPGDPMEEARKDIARVTAEAERAGSDPLNQAAILAVAEARQSAAKWPAYNSAHEGFGVLLEEVDELKAHVWARQPKRDLAAMRAEAQQIAAVALRFAAEVCNEDVGRR